MRLEQHGRAIVALALVASASAGVASPSAALRFERIGSERGLPSNNVTALYQDTEGFVWIGSTSGLVRYDGYVFRSFDHDVSNPASLSDNAIRTIYEDRSKNLWVGTNTGGLERFDRSGERFVHHRHVSSDPASLSHDSVNAILEDRRGRLWVGTQRGLDRFDPSTSTFEHVLSDRAPGHPPGTEYVFALHEDESGALWIGTVGGGLLRFDPDTASVRAFRHDRSDPRSIPNDRVFTILEDPAGALWIGTEGGLCRFDRGDGACEPVPGVPAAGSPPPIVTAMALDGAGTLWVGSWTSDLVAIDVAGMRARAAPRASASADQAADERATALLVDRVGNVWVGTWAAGLLRHRPGGAGIEILEPADDDRLSRDVTAVYAAPSGPLWIGTWGGDLLRQTAPQGPIEPIVDPRAGGAIAPPLAIDRERDRALWVGTHTALLRIDGKDGRWSRFAYDPGKPDGLGPGYVAAVRVDREGRVWVGTGRGGLHRLRPDGATFDRWIHDPANPQSLSDDYVCAIEEDRGGTLWIGTHSGGLNAFDAAGGRFRRFLPVAGDDRSLGHHDVSAILEAADGTLWIGTSGGGLHRLLRRANGEPEGFERVREADGLLDDNVTSLAEDDDGSLWIGTRRGLSRFDPKRRRFLNVSSSDGIPSTQFNRGAAAVGDRAIYFGTSKGLVAIPRATAFPDPRPSPVAFTSVRTLGGSREGSPLDWRSRSFELPYGAVLSVEFAVLDFGSRHRYRYRLTGGAADGTDLGPRHELTLTHLDPGTYRLEVSGRDGQGAWSTTGRPLEFRVVPPFWLTWWFRGGAAALLLGAMIGGFRWRIVTLEERHRQLQTLHLQRERALEEARASREELSQAYDRLRALTRRLEAAKEEERAHIARELHDEMGQALTAAKINLQLLEFAANDDDRIRRYEDMFALLDGLIERVRALSLDLRPPLLDELGFAAALRGYLEAQARRSGIRIDATIDVPHGRLAPGTAIAAFRAVQEGITNVVRHAGCDRAAVSVREDGGGLLVGIRDDGRGFDVGTALDGGTRGEHLGLVGMRERVESHGGSIEIRSRDGGGTEIRIRLPLEA